MSQTYVATFVQFAVIFLPMLGIKVGSDQLTVTVQTIVVVLSGLWVLVRRYQAGGVTPLGARN
jgi:biotin transporter BioY